MIRKEFKLGKEYYYYNKKDGTSGYCKVDTIMDETFILIDDSSNPKTLIVKQSDTDYMFFKDHEEYNEYEVFISQLTRKVRYLRTHFGTFKNELSVLNMINML